MTNEEIALKVDRVVELELKNMKVADGGLIKLMEFLLEMVAESEKSAEDILNIYCDYKRNNKFKHS